MLMHFFTFLVSLFIIKVSFYEDFAVNTQLCTWTHADVNLRPRKFTKPSSQPANTLTTGARPQVCEEAAPIKTGNSAFDVIQGLRRSGMT